MSNHKQRGGCGSTDDGLDSAGMVTRGLSQKIVKR